MKFCEEVNLQIVPNILSIESSNRHYMPNPRPKYQQDLTFFPCNSLSHNLSRFSAQWTQRNDRILRFRNIEDVQNLRSGAGITNDGMAVVQIWELLRHSFVLRPGQGGQQRWTRVRRKKRFIIIDHLPFF